MEWRVGHVDVPPLPEGRPPARPGFSVQVTGYLVGAMCPIPWERSFRTSQGLLFRLMGCSASAPHEPHGHDDGHDDDEDDEDDQQVVGDRHSGVAGVASGVGGVGHVAGLLEAGELEDDVHVLSVGSGGGEGGTGDGGLTGDDTYDALTGVSVGEGVADGVVAGSDDQLVSVDESSVGVAEHSLLHDLSVDEDVVDGLVGVDGDGVEYIFTRTRQEVKPTRPISGNEDDFVPEGWTDNPLGVNSEYRYEWACMRKYIGSIKQWGEFNEPAIWAKWSEDGAPGEPGNTIKVMYAITEAATVVPPLVKTNVNPGSIWQATVPTLTGSKVLWRIEAMFTVRNELVGEWSDPVLISGTASAAPGEYTEFRYAVSDSDTVYPELAKDERDPAGWTTTVPELGEE